VQIHEASHNLLLPNKASNDLYCDLVLGSLALQDVETYRATHGMHHSHLHTERDPDRWIYTRSVGSRRAVLLGILEDLSLRTILRRRRQVAEFLANAGPKRARPGRHVLLAKLAAQLLVLGLFVWGTGAWGVLYYAAIYLYGLLGVFTALVRVRTVVQHYDTRLLEEGEPPPGLFTSRTTVASLFQHVVLGARMDYHFEHHLFPNVPYYTLRELHAELERGGFFSALEARTGQALRTTDFVQSFASLGTSRG
jgi:fatty acid desaturase